jgi:hypothetical protein
MIVRSCAAAMSGQTKHRSSASSISRMPKRDAGDRIESCAHTVPTNRLVGPFHNTKHRTPAILAKEDRDARLTASADVGCRFQ